MDVAAFEKLLRALNRNIGCIEIEKIKDLGNLQKHVEP